MKLSEQKLDPYSLPPGTLVGPWKVKAYEGGGAYGLVYRAVRAGEEQAGEVALKVACYPGASARARGRAWEALRGLRSARGCRLRGGSGVGDAARAEGQWG